jgi:hypothetical protein
MSMYEHREHKCANCGHPRSWHAFVSFISGILPGQGPCRWGCDCREYVELTLLEQSYCHTFDLMKLAYRGLLPQK